MEFTLHTADGYENFRGESWYSFTEHGLLVVTTEDGKQRTYSPSAWAFIEKDPEPPSDGEAPRRRGLLGDPPWAD